MNVNLNSHFRTAALHDFTSLSMVAGKGYFPGAEPSGR
ncbi:hypothetical protein ACP_1779 [Acidobacterium capsulatum ATCC 51196]|uniref:Uncharacterized protein n=1 Tax=Acidobacterium capsulatum (strain ATCC 51196 / DSM 11244 / BCRC 80197 / JCM 7670 / NBRC 15755 / NCIMB 13165 / 161) TaxID=240015 RepID=C1F7P7_ACIC5|nr:hypothetical protein ACP_1779 [Acidobacterium capsulatum ATCC 51196]